MNFDVLLNEFLDGTLDEPGEQLLFNTIAVNDDCRRDFTDSLRVRAAVQQEAASVVVPDDLTIALFTALGYYPFAETAGTTGVVTIAYWLTNTLRIMRTVLPYLAASVVGAAVMWLVLSLDKPLDKASDKTTASAQSTSSQQQAQAITQQQSTEHNQLSSTSSGQTTSRILPSSAIASSTPSVASATRATIQGAVRGQQGRVQNSNEVDEQHSVTNGTEPASRLIEEQTATQHTAHDATTSSTAVNAGAEMLSTPELSTISQRPSLMPLLALTPAPSALSLVHTPVLPMLYPNKQEENTEYSGLELSLRSLQLRPQTQADVASNDNIGVNNLALGMYYRLNNDFLACMEVGREPFVQQYTRESKLALETVRQYPTLWWGGIGGRYEGRSLTGNYSLYPLVQATGGLAESGYYARGVLAVGWDIVPSVTLSAGVEGAWLFYTASNKSYTSTNLGWMYGLSIRF